MLLTQVSLEFESTTLLAVLRNAFVVDIVTIRKAMREGELTILHAMFATVGIMLQKQQFLN